MATAEAPPASTASSEDAAEPRSDRTAAPAGGPGLRPGPVLYLGPAFALYGLFVLWPLGRVVWLAFQRWNGYGPQTFTGFGNFVALLTDPLFRTSLGHTALWDAAAGVIPTVLALALALLIGRSQGKTVFLAALFFPALLPATVVAAVWVLVYSPLTGLLNRLLRGLGLGGLALDWLGDPHLALPALFVAWLWSAVGVGTLVFWAALRAIGREYVELALVEGAGPLWRFRHVLLPGVRRIGAVVLLLNAALGAAVFDLIFVTTGGGPGYATMLVPLEMYGRAFGGRTGQGAAAACIQVGLDLLMVGLAALALSRCAESLDGGEEGGRGGGDSRLATVLLAAALVIFLLPLLWLLVAALEPGRAFALGTGGPGLDPRVWAWSNFSAVWNAGMSSAMGTSAALAAGCVLLTVCLALPAAFALAHLLRNRALRLGALALLLLGLLQPTPVLIIPLFSLLHDLGLLDSVWGILLPEIARAIPFAVLVLWSFMAGTSREIMGAAAVDGASPRQQMLWIAAPLARPALLAVAVWSFITSWNEYLLPTLVSQDGSLQTVPTLLAGFVGKYDTQFGPLAAGCLLALLPTLALYLALRRPAASGLERSVRG